MMGKTLSDEWDTWGTQIRDKPSGVLTRITVASAKRRVDVVLPDEVPVAELLPDLVQRAGYGLADQGQQHGGWALHRSSGPKLKATDSMATAGIDDGEILHLVPAITDWPEPEYDDVVDAVAAGARGLGARWSGEATRIAAVAAAGLVLVVALVSPIGAAFTQDRLAALGLAAVLLGAGILATRAYGEPLVGVALGAYALPTAFLGGWHALEPGADTPSRLLVATTALAVCAVAGALGAGAGSWIFVAGTAAGLLGAAGASASFVTDAARAGALVLIVVVGGVTAAPSLSVRLGRLPLPVVTPPPGVTEANAFARQPDRDRVLAAVTRADSMLTGLVAGLAATAVVAGWALRPVASFGDKSTVSTGVAGLLLTLVAGLALLLRSRLLVTVRQRVPLLAGGAALLLMPFASGEWSLGRFAVPVLAVVVVGLALAGARYRRRAPSPYLGRFADILDTVCLVSLVPLAAAVLDLYAAMRGLSG
jgi:type VII secretion integral membrane protein EccD